MRTTLLLVVGLLASQSPAWSDEVYGGIGLEAEWFKDPSGWEIVQIYRHSPAERAGLYRYQQILSIDGQPTAGKKSEECKGLLRGKIGSSVELVLVDPLLNQTNTVTLIREAIEVVDISRDPVVKAPYYVNANRLNLIDGQKSFTRLAKVYVSTNQVLYVATTNDGVAAIRFLKGHSSGSLTNITQQSVTYSWNYRTSPTSRLRSGTTSATNATSWKEVRPNRWEGKGILPLATVTVENEISLHFDWNDFEKKVGIAYDASVYRVQVSEIPTKESAANKAD